MDDDEWALWRDANAASPLNHARLESPCVECLPAFAAEMRAEDRCDGEPGGLPVMVERIEVST